MVITEEHRNKIDEIIAGMHCRDNYPCYKSDFKKLSRIRMLADGDVVEWPEDRIMSSGKLQ